MHFAQSSDVKFLFFRLCVCVCVFGCGVVVLRQEGGKATTFQSALMYVSDFLFFEKWTPRIHRIRTRDRKSVV